MTHWRAPREKDKLQVTDERGTFSLEEWLALPVLKKEPLPYVMPERPRWFHIEPDWRSIDNPFTFVASVGFLIGFVTGGLVIFGIMV